MKTGSLSRTLIGTSINIPSSHIILSMALSETGHTKVSPPWSRSHSLRCENKPIDGTQQVHGYIEVMHNM